VAKLKKIIEEIWLIYEMFIYGYIKYIIIFFRKIMLNI